VRSNLFLTINPYWCNVELNSTAFSIIPDPMSNSHRQCILQGFCYCPILLLPAVFKAKGFLENEFGPEGRNSQENLDFKRLSLDRTTGDDPRTNIDNSTCPPFSSKPEDKKGQSEFRLSQTYQNSGHARRRYFHTNNFQLQKISDRQTWLRLA